VIVETAGEEDQRPVPTVLLETVANLLSLNLSDNELSVYSRRDHTVVDARELLSLVLEDRPAGDAEVRGA